MQIRASVTRENSLIRGDLVWGQLLPFVLGFGLLLSISTNLRMSVFPVGPGELILAMLAVVGGCTANLGGTGKRLLYFFGFVYLWACCLALSSLVKKARQLVITAWLMHLQPL